MSDTYKQVSNLSSEEKRALLAELLRKKAKGGETTERSGSTSTEWSPLSHGQRALWFLYRLAPQSSAYNLIYAARIRSVLDIPALQRSIQTLIQRHPILTTTYVLRNGEPMQRFHAQQGVHLEEIDASTWSWEQLNRQLSEEGDRPFDLERGPVLRVKLFRRAPQDYLLALTVHHIAVDFWSI